jgi:hypothetical protein
MTKLAAFDPRTIDWGQPTDVPSEADDAIDEMNLKHAVVRDGGRTVVLTEEHDPVMRRKRFTRYSFHDIRQFFQNRPIRIGTGRNGAAIYEPLGQLWLKHERRRQYDGIVFAPGRETPGYFNLWRGFAVVPQAGDWRHFRDHIFEIICSSNADLFDYVMSWLAFGVQHPGERPEVALALRGGRGVGKGTFGRTYGELFGQHYLQIANARHLIGNFNAHLQDAVVLFADEAFWAGDKAGENVLKMLITEPVIPIEGKGRDVVLATNVLHLIIASNSDWVVPAGVDERRFCVLDIDSSRRQDHSYFADINTEMNSGGREAMLHDLLQYDCSKVNLRSAPDTEALREQKVLSLQPNEKWLFDKLMAGRWLESHDGWETIVAKEELYKDYIESLKRVGTNHRGWETELGMFIRKVFRGAEVRDVRRLLGGARKRAYQMPDLAIARACFDQVTHSHHPWPRPDESND